MKKKFLEIGKIVGTHALAGEVRVQPWADSGQFLCSFKNMYFGEGSEKITVARARVHGNVVIMKIGGVDNVSDADALRGRVLYIDRSDAKLPKGRYFICDLVGCKIVDAATDEQLGILEDVLQYPANEVYSVKTPGGKIAYIAAVDEFIAHTDIEAGIIKINVVEGMFDNED
ncbi:MAG: 16S rRNA processing protein RimM [Clostridia bacterium]|nr:16S rRNA processing protein RimM [Oscillospiraceae bacterium]MBQ6796959.1 16S rRNA processing protein RimM [Clostridia bacterium]